MKLFFKIFLALILILLIAIVGVAVVFDPNDYKDDIITLVEEKTGRKLSIPGDISLSLFPWIGIDLGKIEISNAKGFGKQPFAKMEHLQVRAKLWPLFKQQLEADTIVIEGLKLNLSKNRQGVSNWDDLTKKTTKITPKAIEKEPAKKVSNQKENPQEILGAIALNGLKIQDAQFNWHDKQIKQKITVKDVNLSIGALKPETKIPFNTDFHLQEKSTNAKVKFTSHIVFSSDFKKFSFHDTQLNSDLKLATLKPRLSPQLNSALMQLDLTKQTFSTKNLNFSEGSLHLQTQLTASKLLSSPYLNGQLTIQTFNPRELAKKFAIQLPDTADKNVLTKASVRLNLKGSLNKLNLSSLKLTLDDSQLNGNAIYKPTPATSTVNLAIDTINIDRYLPKPVATSSKEEKNKNTTNKSGSTKEAVLIPVALLTAINANADFKIKKIQVMKTHWTNFHIATQSKNGLINVKPLTMRGYDANVTAQLKLRAIKGNALLSGNFTAQNLKAGKLLSDFIGKDKLKGQTSITMSFNTSGIKLSQLKQNLNGNLKLNLKDGTLKGFDLDHQRDVLDAKLRRKPVPKAPQPAETKIASLTASAMIKKGVLSNKDLRAATPLARIVGRGTVDIAKERINYTASVKFTTSTDIKTNKSYEQMSVLPLDISIGGSFDKPSIKPDFEKVLKQAVKRKVNKQKKKITDKAKKDLENKVKDKLKNLFKF